MRKKPALLQCPACKVRFTNPVVVARRKQALETMRKIRKAAKRMGKGSAK